MDSKIYRENNLWKILGENLARNFLEKSKKFLRSGKWAIFSAEIEDAEHYCACAYSWVLSGSWRLRRRQINKQALWVVSRQCSHRIIVRVYKQGIETGRAHRTKASATTTTAELSVGKLHQRLSLSTDRKHSLWQGLSLAGKSRTRGCRNSRAPRCCCSYDYGPRETNSREQKLDIFLNTEKYD
jgi:hypothetical protein